MNQQNRAILDNCRKHLEFYLRTETLQNSGMHAVTFHELKELERVMNEEFLPGYRADLSGCGPCIGAHLKYVYKKYDEWLAAQPIRVEATFPVNDPPDLTPKSMIPFNTGVPPDGSIVISFKETDEERKARLSDPNRIVKRRKKRK